VTLGTATSHGPLISFLYFCAQTSIAGAMNVTDKNTAAKRAVATVLKEATDVTAIEHKIRVRSA
jgi:hypothetical protein